MVGHYNKLCATTALAYLAGMPALYIKGSVPVLEFMFYSFGSIYRVFEYETH